jgi:hypothetical protein
MASDLKHNGFGTFYSTVQPPAYSGLNGGVLEQRWGSRMVEMSCRVRGMSGSIAVPYLGSGTVNIPAGYFSFTPLVDVMALVPKEAINWYDWQVSVLEFGGMNTPVSSARMPSGAQATIYVFGPTGTLPISNYYLPLNVAPFYLRLVNVLPTSFIIASNPLMFGEAQLPWSKMKFKDLLNDPILVFWHAFGC